LRICQIRKTPRPKRGHSFEVIMVRGTLAVADEAGLGGCRDMRPAGPETSELHAPGTHKPMRLPSPPGKGMAHRASACPGTHKPMRLPSPPPLAGPPEKESPVSQHPSPNSRKAPRTRRTCGKPEPVARPANGDMPRTFTAVFRAGTIRREPFRRTRSGLPLFRRSPSIHGDAPAASIPSLATGSAPADTSALAADPRPWRRKSPPGVPLLPPRFRRRFPVAPG
jgi:hypothetical protein